MGLVLALCGSNSSASAQDQINIEDVPRMKIKEIKSKLAERGLECRGCLSKEEHVKLLIENWDRAKDTEKSTRGFNKEGKGGESKTRRPLSKASDERKREAMAEMERQGFGKPTSMSPDDLQGLSESELRDQILGAKGGQSGGNSKGAKKAGSSATSNRQTRSKDKKPTKKKADRANKSAKKETAKKKESKAKKSSSSTKRRTSGSNSKKKRKSSRSSSKAKKMSEEEKLRRSMADSFIEEDLWGQFYGEERDKPERSIHDDADLIEL